MGTPAPDQPISPTKYLIALVLLLLPLFALGISNRGLWGTDEPRVVEISREMALTGNWAVPTLNQEPFLEEPPLYYAAVALTFKAFGVSDRVARIPSAFFGLGGAVALFFLAQMFFGAKLAFLSSFVLATSFEYFQRSHWGVVDSALTCFIITALGFFAAGYRTGQRKRKICCYAAMYFFCTLAFYSKGFIGIAIPGLAVLTFILFDKDPRELLRMYPWLGALIFLAATAPWFLALWQQGGTEYLRVFFVDNHIMRFFRGGDLGHHHPFYYYLKEFPQGFLPWTLLLLPALYRSFSIPAGTSAGARQGLLFAKGWFVSGFILLSLASSKRLLYLLPIFAPLAILTASYVDFVKEARPLPIMDKVFVSMFGMSSLVLGLAVIPMAARGLHKPILVFIEALPSAIVAFSVLAVGLSLLHLRFLLHKRMARFWFFSCGTIWALLVFLLVSLVPLIDNHRSIASFCKEVGMALGPGAALYVYRNDETLRGALPFYAGHYPKELISSEHLDEVLKTDGPVFVAAKDKNGRLVNDLRSSGKVTVVIRRETDPDHTLLLLKKIGRESVSDKD